VEERADELVAARKREAKTGAAGAVTAVYSEKRERFWIKFFFTTKRATKKRRTAIAPSQQRRTATGSNPMENTG
jgi:hypothetical protein